MRIIKMLVETTAGLEMIAKGRIAIWWL